MDSAPSLPLVGISAITCGGNWGKGIFHNMMSSTSQGRKRSITYLHKNDSYLGCHRFILLDLGNDFVYVLHLFYLTLVKWNNRDVRAQNVASKISRVCKTLLHFGTVTRNCHRTSVANCVNKSLYTTNVFKMQ